MRELCSNLSEVEIESGHWMAQEKPTEVSAALRQWLTSEQL
jgi:soluble epoxide hydrolase/lipid-phosphate phosphatase